MGMRAGIIYKDKNGISHLTTSQWSTRIDQTLGHFIANSDNPIEDVRNLFKNITEQFDHVSALEIYRENEDYGFNAETDVSYDNVVYAARGCKFNDGGTNDFSDAFYAMNVHLDGGSIGAMFDEKHPERITFYFDSEVSYKMETRNRSINNLGGFYSDVDKKPQKLMKFDFREN